MLYEPREPINPRTFALRHALLEELKFRRRAAASAADSAVFDALARAIEVTYDASRREFVVQATHGVLHTVPFEALLMYEPRADAQARQWERDDKVLLANRALAAGIVDVLLAAQRGGAR
jgi:hypothetical protein